MTPAGAGPYGRRKIAAGIIVALTCAAAAPARAQAPLNAQLAQCLTVFGAVERLACYDRVARAAARGAPAVAAPPPPVPAPPPARPFGEEQLRSARPAETDQLAAGITRISVNPFGKFTLVLANGQVWRQLESDDRTVTPRKTMHSVHIEHGVMGSYNLRFNDSSLVYKVSRVR